MANEIRVNAMGFVRSNYCMVMQVEKKLRGVAGRCKKICECVCMYMCMCGMNNLL